MGGSTDGAYNFNTASTHGTDTDRANICTKAVTITALPPARVSLMSMLNTSRNAPHSTVAKLFFGARNAPPPPAPSRVNVGGHLQPL